MNTLKRTPMPLVYRAGIIFHDDSAKGEAATRPIIALLAQDITDPALREGNGHMLAAAPHMLLALNLILADLESNTPCAKSTMIALCKSVIAKAMGEHGI